MKIEEIDKQIEDFKSRISELQILQKNGIIDINNIQGDTFIEQEDGEIYIKDCNVGYLMIK